jgi:hypothetical protein
VHQHAACDGVAPYRVTAEFYDLLHGDDYRQRARRLLSFYAAQARVAIIADGVLVLDWPLDSVDVTRRVEESEAVTVGGDEYGGRITMVGRGSGRARMDVRYQVRRSGVLLREAFESFDMWLLGRRQLLAELVAAGLPSGPEGDGDSPLLRVYRCS